MRRGTVRCLVYIVAGIIGEKRKIESWGGREGERNDGRGKTFECLDTIGGFFVIHPVEQ